MNSRAIRAAEKRQKLRGDRKQVGWDDEQWELRFAELKDFREVHGHVRVPVLWRQNAALGRWLAYQRQQGRRGQIEPDRGRRLQELGVEWEIIREPRVEEHDLYMEKMLARLAAYRDRYGHAGVTPGRDRALHLWIARQRIFRAWGTLRKYRKERLDAAGFPWEPIDHLWEEKFVRLVRFKERFGHTRVATEWKEDKVLGRWVEHQRARVRMGTMSSDHRRRLKKLGFQWELDEPRVEEQDRHLELMLARLAAYRKRYGHACVLRSRDRALAEWIQSQRYYRASGTLKEYRRKQMDAVGFPWEPVRYQWEEKFARLRKFKACHGDTMVPAKWEKDRKLGSWVSYQRSMYKAGKLSDERRCRLEELGFVWVVS